MSQAGSDYWQRRYPPRRAVRGGIETRSRRGAFAKTWWGRSLIEVIEGFADPGRMSRGRGYARAGQVVSMRVDRDGVVAEVQGSQPSPFTAVLAVRHLPDEARAELIALVRDTPGMLAEIVSGSLSNRLGPLLLPAEAGELIFDCTCPDDGDPCKHVAAVAYLTAERLDERPLDILTLRGIDLDTLISGVERDTAQHDTDDLYGDRTVLPALPQIEHRAAVDDLDPVPLRNALRLIAADEHTVAAALRELRNLYAGLAASETASSRS